MVSSKQTAFIKGKQILEEPLIVNEVVDSCKWKKNLMMFKVDLEKAYDSLSWDFLYKTMTFMGFSENWCNLIRACFQNVRSYVLLNGSTTKKFSLKRGLRLGDLCLHFYSF